MGEVSSLISTTHSVGYLRIVLADQIFSKSIAGAFIKLAQQLFASLAQSPVISWHVNFQADLSGKLPSLKAMYVMHVRY